MGIGVSEHPSSLELEKGKRLEGLQNVLGDIVENEVGITAEKRGGFSRQTLGSSTTYYESLQPWSIRLSVGEFRYLTDYRPAPCEHFNVVLKRTYLRTSKTNAPRMWETVPVFKSILKSTNRKMNKGAVIIQFPGNARWILKMEEGKWLVSQHFWGRTWSGFQDDGKCLLCGSQSECLRVWIFKCNLWPEESPNLVISYESKPEPVRIGWKSRNNVNVFERNMDVWAWLSDTGLL